MEGRILVLLGAGASVPVIPSVADLTKVLLAWDDLRVPAVGDGTRSSPPELLGPGILDILSRRRTGESRPPFFQTLRDTLGTCYRDRGACLNFEQLIHACDELAHALPGNSDRDDRFRWVLEAFFELKKEYAAWGELRIPADLGTRSGVTWAPGPARLGRS